MPSEEKNIVISNAPDLDSFDLAKMNTTIDEYYTKMSRISPKGAELKIHFKGYEKEGQRQKHIVHASFHFPGNTVRDEEWGWNSGLAVRNVLKKLLRNLQRKLRKD